MIKIKNARNKVLFSEVSIGQTFIDPSSEEISMKIDECLYDDSYEKIPVNTVSLEGDGDLSRTWEDEYVELIDLEITIK
jgi:hypothetical protein